MNRVESDLPRVRTSPERRVSAAISASHVEVRGGSPAWGVMLVILGIVIALLGGLAFVNVQLELSGLVENIPFFLRSMVGVGYAIVSVLGLILASLGGLAART